MFDGNKPYRIAKNSLKILNSRIVSIKPINDIRRKPRSLSDFAQLKANEFRSLLLYFLPICLFGILPAKYIKHFRLLSNSIYRLLKIEISETELNEVESDLNLFVSDFQLLYGDKHMTLNVHLLKHTVNNVRMHGPLWTHSAFHFESYNATLLNFVTGKTDILHQICTKYIIFNLYKGRMSENVREKKNEIEFLGQFKTHREKNITFKIFESGETIRVEKNACIQR